MKLERTIHPIGQGAFYVERFYNKELTANIVYDCGSNNNLPKRAKKIIETTFCQNDKIDILFISHFHADHINGIKTLINSVKAIDNVVIPLLNEFDRKILLLYAKLKNFPQNTIAFIEEPESFFNNDTKIIYITELDSSEKLESITIDQIKTGDKLQSFNKLILSTLPLWYYIPFCKRDENIDRFKDLQDKTITEIFSDNILIKTIKKRFETLPDGIHGNSLMLYSGVIEESKNKILLKEYGINGHRYLKKQSFNESSLYLGDVEFDDNLYKRINEKLGNLVSLIGLVQIPHHGSKCNFSDSLLNITYFFYHMVLIIVLDIQQMKY